MKHFPATFWGPALVLVMAVMLGAAVQSPVVSGSAQERSRPDFEGAYSGQLLMGDGGEKVNVGLEVRSAGENAYRAVLYYGGLPEERAKPLAEEDTVELEGTYEDFTLKLVRDAALQFQYIHGRFTALDESNSYRGHLDRVIRVHPDS